MRIRYRLLKIRQSFQLRVFCALVVVICIFIPATGYVGYLQALRVAQDQLEQYTIGTATQISKRVSSFLAQHASNVNLLASMLNRGLINEENQAELLSYLHLFRNDHPEFVNVYYGDQRGRFTMVPPQSPEVHRIFDPRLRPWYRGALDAQSTHWTDIYLFASTRKPGITVSTPVFDNAGVVRGVCGIDIDLIEFSRFLQNIDIGTKGVAYIFENSSGHLIAHPQLHLLATHAGPLEVLRGCRRQLSRQQQNFGRTDFGGEQYFTAYAPYPGKDWTVGVTLSISDHLRRISLIKQTTITMVVIGILLSSLLSLLLAATITRPLLQLQQGIERIGRGDLDHRVVVREPDIARELARSFNRMALSLRDSLVALKATYAELQEKQKLAAVGKMTAGIAHEIKNPLGIILGSTQVVLDRKRPWEMREKAASFIMDEVVRLDTTLKAFLSFARPSTPVFSEIDLVRLLEETLSATEERYLAEGYRIIRDFPPEDVQLPLFEGDPAQIRQVVMNVMLNGFQAMEGGGALTIRVRAEKEPPMLKADMRFISTRNPFSVAREWLILSISDEGCGIAAEHMEKIMEPFVSFRDDGIGLGLSIVSQLVKLHRGHIQIENHQANSAPENDSPEAEPTPGTTAPTMGTTFHIFFPCILREQP